jgi:hypothetical protein
MIYYVKILMFSETPVNTLFSMGKNSGKKIYQEKKLVSVVYSTPIQRPRGCQKGNRDLPGNPTQYQSILLGCVYSIY